MLYHDSHLIDVSQELRPTPPAARRSADELALAARMLRKLRGHIAPVAGQPGPTRSALLTNALERAQAALKNPADAALDRAVDRLLADVEREADQPLPFTAAADAVEAATLLAAAEGARD